MGKGKIETVINTTRGRDLVPLGPIIANIRDAMSLECTSPSHKLLLGGKLRLLGTYEVLSYTLI